jgi:uncharacterized membrane protein HdeD (DUF308 family)
MLSQIRRNAGGVRVVVVVVVGISVVVVVVTNIVVVVVVVGEIVVVDVVVMNVAAMKSKSSQHPLIPE